MHACTPTPPHTHTILQQEQAAAKRQLPEPGGGPLCPAMSLSYSLWTKLNTFPLKESCSVRQVPGSVLERRGSEPDLAQSTPAFTQFPCALSHVHLNSCKTVSQWKMMQLDPTAVRNKTPSFRGLSKTRFVSSRRKEALQHRSPSRCAWGAQAAFS